MQTLQPTLRLGRDVWDSASMPVSEFRTRADALRAEMTRSGLDALLLYGNGLDECGYPAYISNYTTKLPFAALVILPREGEPVLMFQGSTRGHAAAQATTWIEDLRPCWDIAETCSAALAEKDLLGATLGFAGVRRLMPYDQWQKLSAAIVGAKRVDAEAFVDKLRAVKSDREIARVRRASRIILGALDSLEATGFRAANESLVAARLIHDARVQGAEDVRVLIARPREQGWSFRPPEDFAIGNGETVIFHMAASWERYWSEAVRSFAVESESFEALWNETQERQFQTMISNLRPGRSVGEFARIAEREMGPANAALIHEYGIGNGIGVTAREWPVFSAQSEPLPHDIAIERGMCFSIHLALPDARTGFVIRGDTVIVDDVA